MIKVEYISDSANKYKAIVRNIGFQVLMRRHQRGCTLRYVSKKTGFPINEIDDVEMGKYTAKLDVLIALCLFYKQIFDFENIKKAYELR